MLFHSGISLYSSEVGLKAGDPARQAGGTLGLRADHRHRSTLRFFCSSTCKYIQNQTGIKEISPRIVGGFTKIQYVLLLVSKKKIIM